MEKRFDRIREKVLKGNKPVQNVGPMSFKQHREEMLKKRREARKEQ